MIFLAADPDREGEAIAGTSRRSWACAARRSSSASSSTRSRRRPSTEAFQNPGEVDVKKVDAQQARRILDRLVGYKISPHPLGEGAARALAPGACSRSPLAHLRARARDPRVRGRGVLDGRPRTSKRAEPPPFTAKLVKKDGKKVEIGTGDEAGSRASRPGGGRLRGGQGREQGAPPPSGAAVHHLEAAAGSLREAPLRGEADHAGGAAPVRGRRARRGRPRRSHHLHAYRLDAHLRRRAGRGARAHRRDLRQRIPAREAERLPQQEGRAGRARGDPADATRSATRTRSRSTCPRTSTRSTR